MPKSMPSLFDMMSQLIATPSVSSVSPDFDMGNRAVIDLLAGWLDDLGFKSNLIPIPNLSNKVNLIAQLGEGEDGLVLAGHTDTVPFDQALWHHDPFKLIEEDGKVYGLGTTDMKGFLAIAIEAAKTFQNQILKKPLIILATADEESTMTGALHLTEIGRPRARYAVIGEPTSMVPIRLHKGVVMEALKLTGRSGHSSNPKLGVNALDGMHKAIGTIMEWREELAMHYRNDAFETTADAHLIKVLEELSGQPARSVAFASEAPFLQRLGIQTAIFGPGDVEVAHQPNEYLRADRIQPTQNLLEQLITKLCLTDQPSV